MKNSLLTDNVGQVNHFILYSLDTLHFIPTKQNQL